jgi:hypothetical protein
MKTRLINWLLLMGLCLFMLSSISFAHDLGVAQATLEELKSGQYHLSVSATASQSTYFKSPLLPERCHFVESPQGHHTSTQIRYAFQCSEVPLNVEDKLVLPWQREGVLLKAIWLDGTDVNRFFINEAGVISVYLVLLKVRSGTLFDAAQRYSVLGIEHILQGIDHLLFVLCLLLVVSGTMMLIKTITAFTLAHSITLALATLGIIHFPSLPVEAAIALSIAFLAAEILREQWGLHTGLTYSSPWLVAFGFGLLHGLGFAGALAELGLPTQEVPVALLFFNIGVEIGQLMFVSVCLLLIWAFRHSGFFQSGLFKKVVAYSVGGVATFWFLERTLAIMAR